MKHEALSVPITSREAKAKIGESVIVIARWDDPKSKKIVLQDFIRDGASFIPVFSSWASFDHDVKGSGFEEEGVEIDRNFFGSMLRGDEALRLDPGSAKPTILRKSDLTSPQ